MHWKRFLHPHLHPRSFAFTLCSRFCGSKAASQGADNSPIFRGAEGFGVLAGRMEQNCELLCD